MGIRVYEFGLLAPVEGEDVVRGQLRAAHKYYNKLIELERDRRKAAAAVLAEDTSVAMAQARVDRIEERLERLRGVAKARSIAERKRGDRRASTKLTIAALKQARRLLRDAKTGARDQSKDRLDLVNALANDRRKEQRATCGVYWGTYLLIEEAVDQARKSIVPPRFKPWARQGRLGVQLQGGEPVENIFADDSRLRIEPVPPEAFTSPVRGERRRLSRTKLWLRVGSGGDSGRDPVWAVFPMIMHRQIPPGSVVKRITVVLRTCSTFEKWTAQITVHEPDNHRPIPVDGGLVAIDLGWRARDGQLRVGYRLDEQGKGGEILVPKDILGAVEKANSLRSIRDRQFDLARAFFVSWMKKGILGDKLAERGKHAHAWKAPGKMVAFMREWGGKSFDLDLQYMQAIEMSMRNPTSFEMIEKLRLATEARQQAPRGELRVEGDEAAYDWLVYWVSRDTHLWQYEAGTRRRALLRRREGFRILAAELARTYRTLVLEDFDLREMSVEPEPEKKDEPQSKRARALKTVASPSELRHALLNAFGPRHVIINAAHTTKQCSSCGYVNDWEDQSKLELTCNNCGESWDQDQNACRNLLRLANDTAPEEAAEKKPGRAQRLREAKEKAKAAKAAEASAAT